MNKLLLNSLLGISLLFSGCAGFQETGLNKPPFIAPTPLSSKLNTIPELDGEPIYVGVNSFKDLTGARKQSDNYASFSAAVTQGGEAWLIESLLESNGWFKVLERGQLDTVMRERALVQQTREDFTDDDETGLKPLLFAGLLIHGGIISYDTNQVSGGIGAAYLGIGAHEQHRKDVVTVSLRFVSTLTSEILLSSTVSKTIYSTSVGSDVFKFVNQALDPLEFEIGFAKNELVSVATRAAIDLAIVDLIEKGEKKEMWKFKSIPVKKNTTPKKQEKEQEKTKSTATFKRDKSPLSKIKR
jgi:curli production assembly/transport component CsgG